LLLLEGGSAGVDGLAAANAEELAERRREGEGGNESDGTEDKGDGDGGHGDFLTEKVSRLSLQTA